MENEFQQRIGWTGDISLLLRKVCEDYQLGLYISHSFVLFGYEDFNLILLTEHGKFFIKIFASFRDEKECQRYIQVICDILKLGVTHPQLLQSNNSYFYKTAFEDSTIRLCVMDFIEGDSFFTLHAKPSESELKFIIEQVALINQSKLNPSFLYDSWAIVNFLEEYKKKEQYLTAEDRNLITLIVNNFQKIDIQALPYSLVHGDLIKTNIMKTKKGELYLIDFSVANYYPRIVELAVLCNNMFFDEESIKKSEVYYTAALEDYQKHIRLTPQEIEMLPLFIRIGHAMHILCANYEKVVNENTSQENTYWLDLGRKGLEYSNIMWGDL